MKLKIWLPAMLLTFVMVGRGKATCTNPERYNMDKQFSDCFTRYRDQYFESTVSIKSSRKLETATCQLFSQIVNTCGEIWKECYDAEEMRWRKDMYIVALMTHEIDQGIDVKKCDVVKEFR